MSKASSPGLAGAVRPCASWWTVGRPTPCCLTLCGRSSECHISLPQGQGHTPVILGEPGDEALLGVVTLEILGLVLHPFTRQLQPMRMLLA